jgi:hypothetical protein
MTPAFTARAGREQDDGREGAPRDNIEQCDPRLPVWLALSDLYLDTDVAALYPHIAETLADSPYALDALHDMLMYDIHPALHPNLMSVAGEWAGFDDEWLLVRIAQVRKRPRWRRRLSHLFVRWIRDDWHAVAAMIVELRAATISAQATQAQATQA